MIRKPAGRPLDWRADDQLICLAWWRDTRLLMGHLKTGEQKLRQIKVQGDETQLGLGCSLQDMGVKNVLHEHHYKIWVCATKHRL